MSIALATRLARLSLHGCVLFFLVATAALPVRAQDVLAERYRQERALYLQAREALARNDMATFSSLRGELLDYPLLPYLDHAQLLPTLDGLPEAEVRAFLDTHRGSVLARRLQREWQAVLARKNEWQRLITIHDSANSSVDITCQVLHARLLAGDDSALDEVAPLWNVARSQPNICDPLFDAWRAAGRLTPEIGWQRFEKALVAGNLNFARYLSTLLPERERNLAVLWLDTAQQPSQLANTDAYAGDAPELVPLLLDTLRRLARGNAEEAWRLLDHYAASHAFPESDKLALGRYVLQRFQLSGDMTRAESLLLERPRLASDTLVEAFLRDALRQQQWERVEGWLPWLSDEAKASERWRYWRARGLARHDPAQADALFREVALTRSFYGFLSADRLGVGYSLVDRPVQATEETLLALLAHPALARAVELYLTGDERDALAEWQQALAAMSESEVMTAARLADRLGWHRNGIQALIQVSYWDDLEVRFPFAYRDMMSAVANRHDSLDPTFVYAIARQESAFIPDIRSSAGATGLMQLMPGTARDVARETGLHVVGDLDLSNPEVNLTLGSHYLAKMLRDFDGNRAFAAAAYNAGPSRVRGWLAASQPAELPLDIWIETLPFGETRGYVQNVLAFAVIYGYRMGMEVSLLTPEEAASLL